MTENRHALKMPDISDERTEVLSATDPISWRIWSRLGSVYYDRETVLREIRELKWIPMPAGDEPPLEVAAMPGLGVQEILRQLGNPRCSAIAINGVIGDRFGLYGLRLHYKNTTHVQAYYLDLGSVIEPIAHDVVLPARPQGQAPGETKPVPLG